MYYLLLGIVLVGILVALSRLMRRRQHALIKAAIESMGGRVGKIGSSPDSRRSVLFVSANGDLRHVFASIRRGRVELQNEMPYEEYIEPRIARSPESNRDFWRFVESQKLPGFQDYERTVRSLADGSRTNNEIKEARPAKDDDQPTFAGVLQCIRMQQPMSRDAQAGVLELMVEGRPINVAWRIEGTAPARVLLLSVAPQDPGRVS